MRQFLTLVFLCTLFLKSYGQTQEVKELGKVNYNGNSELKLSATIDSGVFSYTLTDLSQPDSPIFSFGLIDNSLENFKKNIPSNLDEKYKRPDDRELEKYFFYFVNQNIFLIENLKGGKAMDIRFNDSLQVYSFNHPDFTTIKPIDIYFLLKELFPNNEIEKSKYLDIKGAFDHNNYTSFMIENQPVFDNLFKSRLEKISGLKPKTLKWEELYKEINYRYYRGLIGKMQTKIDEDKDTNSKKIKEKEDSIKLSKNKLTHITRDSTEYTETRNQLQLSLSKLMIQREQLIKKVPSKVKVSTLNETLALEDKQKTKLLRTISWTNEKLTTLMIPVDPKPLDANITTENAKEVIENDSIRVSAIFRDFQILLIVENQIANLESEINDYTNWINNLNESSTIEKNKIENLLSEKENIQIDIKNKIREDLNDLNKSNKFLFTADKVQMEVNRGYLENLIVSGSASVYVEKYFESYIGEGSFPSYSLKFINDYPIGISSKKDIERLSNIKLYARFENNTHYELRLGELITNVEEILALDRRDYSPKDNSYTIDLRKEKIKEFHKPDTQELFEIKIFSDFIGINENNPNGLIQLEVDKEIPLVTKRIPRPYVWAPVRFLVNKNSNLGFFNFIKPQFIFSKIENDQRYLVLKPLEDQQNTKYGTSTLDLKQFERYSIGADLNLLLYNIPYAKSTFLLNGGLHFGRTDLASNDSTPQVNDFPRSYTNTIQPSLDLLWRINGDERYGIEISYGVNWVFSDELFFTQRAKTLGFNNYSEFEASNEDSAIGRFTMLAYLNLDPNTAGRLFFRYRFNSEFAKYNNNYSQLQVGYTTFLTKREK